MADGGHRVPSLVDLCLDRCVPAAFSGGGKLGPLNNHPALLQTLLEKVKHRHPVTDTVIEHLMHPELSRVDLRVQEGSSVRSLALTEKGVLSICMRCDSLRELDLGGYRGSLPAQAIQLLAMKQLERIGLAFTRVSSHELLALVSPALEHVDISHTAAITRGKAASADVLDTILTLARCCPRLRVVDISGADADANLLVAGVFSLCPAIERLVMDGAGKDLSRSEGSSTAYISARGWLSEQRPRFRCLAGVSCRFSNRVLSDLISLAPNLHTVLLQGVSGVDDTVAVALSNCHQLSRIQVGESVITDAGLQALARGCSQMTSVDFSWCDEMTQQGLSHIFTALHGLQEVNMRKLDSVEDVVLDALAEHKMLQRLDISRCSFVHAEAVERLCSCCSQLRVLEISWLEDLTDAHLLSIVRSCPLLEKLDLAGCKLLTDRSIDGICGLRPTNLRVVNLEFVDQVTDEALERLVAQIPRVQTCNYFGTQFSGVLTVEESDDEDEPPTAAASETKTTPAPSQTHAVSERACAPQEQANSFALYEGEFWGGGRNLHAERPPA